MAYCLSFKYLEAQPASGGMEIRMYEFKKYNHDTYMLPLWEGDCVYNETVMFVAEDKVPLLYKPDEIISVMSYDLKTEYAQGVDYLFEDGMFVRTKNSRIPMFTEEEYYPENPVEGTYFGSAVEGHKNIYFGEGATFFSRQVHVTYKHSDNWNGFLPGKTVKFKNFIEKLSNNEPIKILFYGDSITTGVCSSKAINSEPFADCWAEMVVKSLEKYFDNHKIEYVNTAVGGFNSDMGIMNLQSKVIDIKPDFMFLGFGMNDGWLPPDEYKLKIKTMIDALLKECPDCEVAVISTMLPHFRVAGFYCAQEKQEEALYSLAREYSNVDVIPVTSMHKEILKKKRYYDMTGNNVNHPNDFLARVYAQTIIRVLLG